MRITCSVLILWMMPSAVWANGRIEGRVDHHAAQDYLSGAVVKIPSLNLQTTTRSDGRFLLSNVPSGQHGLEVGYLGFETVKQSVLVESDQVAEINITMTNTIEEIVVYGQAGSTASALNQQRAADTITSIVSSDEFGQLPDANLSEALQRIPGVFLERDHGEGRFVGIRGIDPNLNVTSINGTSVPAPESDTRAVALDVIPTDLVETIEVRKTFTPDMDPNGLGGSINVKSLSAFDRKGQFVKVRGEGHYNELESQASPRLAATFSDTFDLGADGDSLGVAFALSWFDRDFGADNVEVDGGWVSDLETIANEEFKGAEEIEQRNYDVNRERLGAALNFDFRPNDNAQYYLRTLYSEYTDQENRTRNEFKLDKGDAIAGTARSATWDDAELHRELKSRLETQEILSVTAGATHWFDQWTFDYSLGYAKASEAEPNRIDAEFTIEGVQLGYTGIGATPQLFADPLVLDANNYELTEITVEDNSTEEEQHSLRFDFEREIYADNFNGSVKFGAKFVRRDKFSDAQLAVFDGFPGDPSLAPFVSAPPEYGQGVFGPGISLSRIDSFIRTNKSAFELDDDDTLAGSLGGDYSMIEDVNAAYLMSRMEIGEARLVYGLRYEQTDFDAKGQRILFDSVNGGGDATPQAVSFSDDYNFLLPSVNFRYALSDDLIVRAAWYETFARPSFGDLSPGGEIEFEVDGVETELKAEVGNPLLQPLEATNLDLTLEFYESEIGLLSVGLFYKQLDNYITLADVGGSIDLTQFVGATLVDNAEVLQPINGESADLTGLELAWVKNWTNLPGLWGGLLTSVNATFTDSEAELALRPGTIDLPRQSDRVFNMVVGYEDERLSARIAATYKSEALIGMEEPDDPTFDIYQDEHLQIDLSVHYNVSKNWQVYLEANNLTDEPYYAYFGSRQYNATYETFGRTYALGIQYKAL